MVEKLVELFVRKVDTELLKGIGLWHREGEREKKILQGLCFQLGMHMARLNNKVVSWKPLDKGCTLDFVLYS